jgi:hypothetical protein
MADKHKLISLVFPCRGSITMRLLGYSVFLVVKCRVICILPLFYLTRVEEIYLRANGKEN